MAHHTETLARRLFVSLPGDTGPGPETAAPRATARALCVPPDLRPVIGQALMWQEALEAKYCIVEHVLPDGRVRLWFDLSGSGAGPMVLGPRLEAQTVLLQGRMAGLSVALTAAAARAVLGAPVRSLRGQAVGLADFWGPEAGCFGDRIAQALDLRQMAETLWHGLRRRLQQSGFSADDGQRTLRLTAAVARGDAPDRIGLGERRLQQLCAEHLGLSPREHRRLMRWHGLLRGLRRVDRPDWAVLALAHGWYDQAHMLRDFRVFAGMTPTAFRAISGPSKTAVQETG